MPRSARELKRRGFLAIIVVMVRFRRKSSAIAALGLLLALGACGFLPKSEGAEVMLQALRLVLSGGIYMPAQALDDYRNGQPPAPKPDAGGLTPRQLDVLHLLMRGEPNKLIARELGLTEGTVKIHIAAILRALQARNRTEAVVVARQLGISGSGA
ncbi:MAG: response regulator transcription factor [Burkholderiales bacterium]|nr:response regulator transcription factor [Burkholderiales bacterium]